jgi:regulatory protein
VLLSESETFEKLKKYCAYQERSQFEVRQKLVKEGVRGVDAEAILAGLITDGFLSEERFARTFARGKFRIKKWGRLKIQSALKSKGVSPTCIRCGLSEINETEYLATLKSLVSKLPGSKINANPNERLKTYRILRAKGYEANLVSRFLGAEPEE